MALSGRRHDKRFSSLHYGKGKGHYLWQNKLVKKSKNHI
jgi:hypothetical protein